jgi:PadR family transcriptional regulator PadR
MMRQRPHSAQTVGVLQALAVDASTWRYGYDLCSELGLKSGSLYPILIRLADRGFLESSWEQAGSGKPPRHVYRLTGAGIAEAAAAEHRTGPLATRHRELGTA